MVRLPVKFNDVSHYESKKLLNIALKNIANLLYNVYFIDIALQQEKTRKSPDQPTALPMKSRRINPPLALGWGRRVPRRDASGQTLVCRQRVVDNRAQGDRARTRLHHLNLAPEHCFQISRACKCMPTGVLLWKKSLLA